MIQKHYSRCHWYRNRLVLYKWCRSITVGVTDTVIDCVLYKWCRSITVGVTDTVIDCVLYKWCRSITVGVTDTVIGCVHVQMIQKHYSRCNWYRNRLCIVHMMQKHYSRYNWYRNRLWTCINDAEAL